MRTQRPVRPAPEWIDELVGEATKRASQVLSPPTAANRVARLAARIAAPSFARGFDMRPAVRRTDKTPSVNLNSVAS